MTENTVQCYPSHRNDARLMQAETGLFVVKTFCEEDAFRRELHIYSLLQGKELPCAKVLSAQGKTLTLTQLPGQTLLEHLERQEATELPQWEVWDKLVAWLTAFYQLTGMVMTDVNLRNFLYDPATCTLYGVDFEESGEGSLAVCAGRVAAFIRTYKPENTRLKQEISQYVLDLFAKNCEMGVESLHRETERQEANIIARRKNRI